MLTQFRPYYYSLQQLEPRYGQHLYVTVARVRNFLLREEILPGMDGTFSSISIQANSIGLKKQRWASQLTASLCLGATLEIANNHHSGWELST